MKGWPALGVLLAMATVVLGLPLGLYALLTRGRRRMMREIRSSAAGEGWQFHRSMLRGDPTEFDIQGRTHGGTPWSMTCRGTGEQTRGWTMRLVLRFPTLSGRTDMAILPRDTQPRDIVNWASQATPEVLAKIAKFSGAVAGAVEFLKDAPESPSGLPAFDRAYQIFATKDFPAPFVDAALAKRMLEWPASSVKLHSLLAWRNPFGLHVEAHLPGPPNWATVAYFHEVAEAFIARVPAGMMPSGTIGIVDRIAEKLLE